ncbi:MAG: ribonuclease HII [Anaerolineae bacterium]
MEGPSLAEEMALYGQGYQLVAGLDEAGRGAWAGPVVAGAVLLPLGRSDLASSLSRVRDSKKLTPRQRQVAYDAIMATALATGVGVVGPEIVDRLGIVPATRLAMRLALARFPFSPQFLLIDALELQDLPLPQKGLPKGDGRCLSIAAASVVAKVSRDRLMVEFDSRYPGYGFARHKGYGTPQHQEALNRLGPIPIHRLSYAPLRRLKAGEKLG